MHSSFFLRFLPFFFVVFLFVSSAALAAANINAPLSINKEKLKQLIKIGSNIKPLTNDETPTDSTATTTTTIAPSSAADSSTTTVPTTTTPAPSTSTSIESTTTTVAGSTSAPIVAYVRLVLTLKQKAAERLITPNAQGNTRRKLRDIIADSLGRPADGLNITMTIDDIEGQNPNKKNPRVFLILLITLSSTDTAIKSISDGVNNSSSALSSQLMQETGADSISVQTTYGFPPSTSDGLPFTSSDDSLFEAYKTLILAVSVSIIGVVLLGAVILFLTKTKERRERLLELFRIGGRGRREANQSSSTFDDKRNSGSKRATKKTSTRHSGRGNNSGRNTTSGRNSTINSTVNNNNNSTINNSTVHSVVKNQV